MKDPILNDSIVPDMGEGTRTTDVARVPSTPTDGRTLDQLCQREARRWLCLLGDEMARTPYDYEALRERSKSVRVPLRVLARQKRAFDAKGIDGLLPDWTELSTKEWQAAIKQYQLIGDEADAVEMTDALIAGLATRNGWTPQRAERWLHRYRIGGLWGLAPHHNPGKRQRHARDERRFANLATLSKEEMDVALESIRERLLLLGDLVNYDQVTNEQVEEQAKKTGKSARTIRYYLADYRDARLAGLARRPRSDKGNRHSINGDMEELIRAIRLTNPDWSDRAVLEEACKMARVLGEPEPSEFHVRDIVDRIPAPIRALADVSASSETSTRSRTASSGTARSSYSLIGRGSTCWSRTCALVMRARKCDLSTSSPLPPSRALHRRASSSTTGRTATTLPPGCIAPSSRRNRSGGR